MLSNRFNSLHSSKLRSNALEIMIKFPALQENLPAAESWWDAAFCATPLLRSGGFARE
jgi:hypothetical protein